MVRKAETFPPVTMGISAAMVAAICSCIAAQAGVITVQHRAATTSRITCRCALYVAGWCAPGAGMIGGGLPSLCPARPRRPARTRPHADGESKA
jgi:hypothetical protein